MLFISSLGSLFSRIAGYEYILLVAILLVVVFIRWRKSKTWPMLVLVLGLTCDLSGGLAWKVTKNLIEPTSVSLPSPGLLWAESMSYNIEYVGKLERLIPFFDRAERYAQDKEAVDKARNVILEHQQEFIAALSQEEKDRIALIREGVESWKEEQENVRIRRLQEGRVFNGLALLGASLTLLARTGEIVGLCGLLLAARRPKPEPVQLD